MTSYFFKTHVPSTTDLDLIKKARSSHASRCAESYSLEPEATHRRGKKRQGFPPRCITLAILFVLAGCSSFFSLSWHTEKKVERAYHKRTAGPLKKNIPRWCERVQVARLDQRSPTELNLLMTDLKLKGFKIIYFRVFQNPGDVFFHILPPEAPTGVYFKTSHAPMVSNLLPTVCQAAHRHGIKVYAWINTLNATFLHCSHCGHIWKIDLASGRRIKTSRLSPFDPRVRSCLAGLFKDLARYSIDGILIQDDFVLHYNEDVSPLALHAYQKSMGIHLLHHIRRFYLLRRKGEKGIQIAGYRPSFWSWSKWKNRQLALFLKQLIKTARETNSSVKVAIDVNYESLLSPKNALAWFSRDIPTLERIAHPDQYAVMSYQRQMERELEKSRSEIFHQLRAMVKTALVWIPTPGRWIFKIQTIDWKTHQPIRINMIKATANSITSVAPVHICLMPYAPFLSIDISSDKSRSSEISRSSAVIAQPYKACNEMEQNEE